MITLTATWTDWTYGLGKDAKIIHPTLGRDRPIVIECSTPFTAVALRGVLIRLGMDVTEEDA